MHLNTLVAWAAVCFLVDGSVVVDLLLIVTPIMGFCNCSMFYVHSSVAIILLGRESWLLCLFVFLVSRDCYMAFLYSAMGLSSVCDCDFPDHTHLLFLCIYQNPSLLLQSQCINKALNLP